MQKRENVTFSLGGKVEEKFDAAKKEQIEQSNRYQELGKKVHIKLAGPAYNPF